MPTLLDMIERVQAGAVPITAGGPGSGCHGPNCGHHGGGGFAPREPTGKELAHERMRVRSMTEQELHTRLGKMTKPQKLYAFYRVLEDENHHTFNKKVIQKLINMGWDGSHPS